MTSVKSEARHSSVAQEPLPTGATWMYFRGNGHERGRNGSYDHTADVQRYFYVPILESGVDRLPWSGGFSLCWQYIPVKQAAYYTTFFYSASQDTDFYDLLNDHGYVGCHPYPISAHGEAGDDFRLHKWEISIDGQDITDTPTGYGQLHTQAFRCEVTNPTSGASALRFYTNVTSSDVSAQHKVQYTHSGAYASAPPHPSKALVFGNAPWWRDHQHERLSGYIRRIKVFAGELSDQDLLEESLSDSIATAAGASLLWWAKINPLTPDDLASDFGATRTARWIDDSRCEIIANTDLASHHALVNANTIGNLLHMERG